LQFFLSLSQNDLADHRLSGCAQFLNLLDLLLLLILSHAELCHWNSESASALCRTRKWGHGMWYSRPELNWDQRFRKPLLYPFELREPASTKRSHDSSWTEVDKGVNKRERDLPLFKRPFLQAL